MPYELVQTSPVSVKATKSLESFWFFSEFKVDPANKILQVERGYFAAYISQKAGPPLIESFYKTPTGDKADYYSKIEISNVAAQKISINYARLVDSRFSQFSNEVSQLHLFDLSSEDSYKKEWIDAKGWTPKFTNPVKNDDNKYFLKQTLNFDQVKDRYIYWLSTQTTANGTERFGVATPFIANPLTANILALHQLELPKIQVSVDEKPWSYPSGEELPGTIKGFVMIAEGAFKSIALTGEVDDLLKKVTSKQQSKDILTYLSQIVHEYPTPIARTITKAPVTYADAVVPSTPELPIEILYMEGLNSGGNFVEMIVK